MFYNEKEINDAKTCPYCVEELDDPRLLPCGTTLCNECIVLNIKNEQISCAFCSETHTLPAKSGFPLNKFALEILKQKPNEIYRSESVHKLKSMLKILNLKAKELDFGLATALDEIAGYCASVKNDIQLAIECLLEEARRFGAELLGEVDSYEKNCVKILEADRSWLEQKKTFTQNLVEFSEKWNKYLNQFRISDCEVDRGLREAKMYYSRAQLYEMNLSALKFAHKRIQFAKTQEKLTKHAIGWCYCDEMKTIDANFHNLKQLDLKQVNVNQNLSSLKIVSLSNPDEFILLYLDNGFIQLNKIRNLESVRSCWNLNNQKIVSFRLSFGANRLLVFSLLNTKHNKFMLDSFDSDLMHSKSSSLNFNVLHLATNATSIFCLLENNRINMLNHQFDCVKVLERDQDSYKFPDKIYQLEANLNSLFLLGANNPIQNEIHIVNIENGATERVLNLNSELSFSILNSNYLLVRKNDATIAMYNENDVDFYLEMELDEKLKNSELIEGNLNKFLFYDSSLKIVYYN